jgi:cytochrome c oxidase cbb3-type subunit 3
MFSRCLSICLLSLLLTGCEREARRFTDVAAVSRPQRPEPMSGLQPGPWTPPQQQRAQTSPTPLENNAVALGEGKQLYLKFNCSGCHAMGGGGMGPPLMDDRWIYGGDSRTIVETITYGRPNGMPAFGSKLGRQQIWQLAAYVRSMSGNVPKDAAPGRTDSMHAKAPEAMTPKQPPKEPAKK